MIKSVVKNNLTGRIVLSGRIKWSSERNCTKTMEHFAPNSLISNATCSVAAQWRMKIAPIFLSRAEAVSVFQILSGPYLTLKKENEYNDGHHGVGDDP